MEPLRMVDFETSNYVTGTAQERLAQSVATPAPTAAEQPADGRVASVDGTEQAPWGWGLAPAEVREPLEQALTDLPTDPAGFSGRQQDAVRRDIGAQVGDYTSYDPVPFVGR